MDVDGEREQLIPYDELAEIDLDSLSGLSGEGMAEHFHRLAERASEGQLREVLGIGPEAGGGDLGSLVESYVSRRMATVARLRALLANP